MAEKPKKTARPRKPRFDTSFNFGANVRPRRRTTAPRSAPSSPKGGGS